MAKLIIEICPTEGRASACTQDGGEIKGSEFEQDMLDCVSPGDCSEACKYVLNPKAIGVDFHIVARNDAGEYENREATAEEKEATCSAIYFDSVSDFGDEDTAEQYLVWQAASEVLEGGE